MVRGDRLGHRRRRGQARVRMALDRPHHPLLLLALLLPGAGAGVTEAGCGVALAGSSYGFEGLSQTGINSPHLLLSIP